MIKTIEELLEIIRQNNPNMPVEKIVEAYECAKNAHDGQKRKSGEDYIIHPIAVAGVIANMGLDSDSIIAGILHDCIEDTKFDFKEISLKFGEDVAVLVDGVTRLGMIKYSKEQEQMEDLRKMFMAMAKDIRVILIKLADRLHNMRTIEYMTDQKRRSKALETMEIYAPIAHRLGMQAVKWELEDLSMKILDPVGFTEIVTGLGAKKEERQLFLDENHDKIAKKLKDSSINAQIEGRVKHIYSIYRKMFMQNKTMDEIYDICAIRVIVDSVSDCYNVLGHMHDIYKPIPGRFKDYISTPKPNGYKSLHTTVIGRAGIPFEIQIRTEQMHQMSELGVAAHWKYKAGVKTNPETFAWIRMLLEAGQDSQADDFIKNIKVDLFADEVFVFTPRGEVINMPAGAVPVDFAYAIHSAVGNKMISAKINGRNCKIDTALKNGDVVEIITSKEEHGPSRGWLSIVKTTEARNKIKQWFKKECKEENITRGKEDLERELKSYLVYNTFIENESIRDGILKKLAITDIQDLYEGIGYGGISLGKVANRVKDDVIRLKKQKERENNPITNPSKAKKSDSGVIVGDLDSCLVKFARCCSPLPGDDITGFITRGYGVSVHKTDCVNTKCKECEKERWIAVRWDEEYLAHQGRFNSSLQVSASTRMGMISDILGVLNTAKTPILEMNAKDLKDGYSRVDITLQIISKNQFENIINKLKGINGVIDVKRSGKA